MKKRILSSIMALCLMMTLLPVTALAASDDNTNLPEADENGVIKLDNDYEVSTLDPNTTYDLNGYTLTYNSASAVIVTNGNTLTFKDSSVTGTARGGKLVLKGKTSVTDAYLSPEAGGTVNASNITIACNTTAFFPKGNAAAVNITSCDVTAACYCVGTNAATVDNYGVKITLKDSTFTATSTDYDNCAVYINVEGTLDIDNCNITGDRQAVMVRAGDATITNSTLTVTGNYYTTNGSDSRANGAWSAGNEVTSSALVVGNYVNGTTNSYTDDATVTLVDTKVTSTASVPAIYVDANQSYSAEVNVSGANTKVTGAVTEGQYASNGSSSNTEQIDITITAGTFVDSTNNKADVSKYYPKDALLKQDSDGTVVAAEAADGKLAVAEVNGVKYSSLASAINAAGNIAATVTLLADTTEDIIIGENQNIILDLNGKTITGQVQIDADLTIQDSAGQGKITSSGVTIGVGNYDKNDTSKNTTGKLVLNSGTIESTGGYGVAAFNGSTVIVNDGTITSKDSALSGNNTLGDMNFEVNGGTLTAAQGPAIYMPGQVKLTVTGGTLNGGISLRMGQVEISGGTINAITKNIDSPKEYYNYSGNAWLPDALYVFGGTYTSDNETYGNSLNLKITGGTFNCTNGQGSAVAIYDIAKTKQETKIEISGDAVLITNAENRSAYQVLSLEDIGVTTPATGYGQSSLAGQVNSAISGGSFSTSVAEYVVKGLNAELVKSSGNAPYSYYTSMEEALKDAQTGDTVNNLASSDDGSNTAYTVTLNYGYGNKTITVKTNTITLPTASRPGYRFLGWADTSGNIYRAGNTVDIKTDTTFTAQWHKNASPAPSYSVSTPTAANGTVTVSPSSAQKNAMVTITVKPDTGYQLAGLTVTDANGNRLTLTQKSDTQYTFTMPASKVTVEATFEEIPQVHVCPAEKFTDVDTTQWYHEAIDYVIEAGMMNGVAADKFAPNSTTTRGMIVTILYRLEGEPAVAGASAFTDVESGAWYADPIAWAAAKGVVNGTSATTFDPNDPITREQMAAILYRYASYKGYDVAEKANLSSYTDAGQISAYATDAMAWANAQGLITGVTKTTLEPQGNATRAQVATLLMRFCVNVVT